MCLRDSHGFESIPTKDADRDSSALNAFTFNYTTGIGFHKAAPYFEGKSQLCVGGNLWFAFVSN